VRAPRERGGVQVDALGGTVKRRYDPAGRFAFAQGVTR
jgi:hypothetical protein